MNEENNPLDKIRDSDPFIHGPGNSDFELDLKTSILKEIIETNSPVNFFSRMHRSFIGKPIWLRPKVAFSSFVALIMLAILISVTAVAPSALAEVIEATEKSEAAFSGSAVTRFEISDSKSGEIKHVEEVIFRFEGDDYSLTKSDFEIRGVGGSEYFKKDGDWYLNEAFRGAGIRSVPKNFNQFKGFLDDATGIKKLSRRGLKEKYKGKLPAEKIFLIRGLSAAPEIVDLAKNSIEGDPHQAEANFTVIEGLLTEIEIETEKNFLGWGSFLVRIHATFTGHGESQNIVSPDVKDFNPNNSFLGDGQNAKKKTAVKRFAPSELMKLQGLFSDLQQRRPGLCKFEKNEIFIISEMISRVMDHFECLQNAGESEAASAFSEILKARLDSRN